MELIFPSLIYFLVALLILAIYRINPKFKYFWLLSFSFGMIIWIYIWALSGRLPIVLRIPIWDFIIPFQPTISFVLDSINWPIFMLVSIIMVAVISTDGARPRSHHWLSWSGGFGLLGMGMLAVISSNLFTLIFIWLMVDIVQLLASYNNSKTMNSRKNSILFFLTNIIGLMIAFGAFLYSSPFASSPDLFVASPIAVPFLILAAGFRLGVLPLQAWFLQTSDPWEANNLPVRIIPSISSLILLIRIADFGIVSSFSTFIFIFTLISGIYSAIAWVRTENETHAPYYLAISISSLVMISAIFGEPISALSWSLVLISVVGFWILFSTRGKDYYFQLIGILAIVIGLPFFPNFSGLLFFDKLGAFYTFFVLWIPVFIVVGLIKKFSWNSSPINQSTRWIPILYFFGLALLPLAHISLAVSPVKSILFINGNIGWIIEIILLAIVFVIVKREIRFPVKIIETLEQIFSFRWFYKVSDWFYKFMVGIIDLLSRLLESRAGIIWSLILYSIFVSLFSSQGGN